MAKKRIKMKTTVNGPAFTILAGQEAILEADQAQPLIDGGYATVLPLNEAPKKVVKVEDSKNGGEVVVDIADAEKALEVLKLDLEEAKSSRKSLRGAAKTEATKEANRLKKAVKEAEDALKAANEKAKGGDE